MCLCACVHAYIRTCVCVCMFVCMYHTGRTDGRTYVHTYVENPLEYKGLIFMFQIVHCSVGLVRSNVVLTAFQVFSRVFSHLGYHLQCITLDVYISDSSLFCWVGEV